MRNKRSEFHESVMLQSNGFPRKLPAVERRARRNYLKKHQIFNIGEEERVPIGGSTIGGEGKEWNKKK